MYLLCLLGNLLIILLIFSNASLLHAPMYFFLCHLSLADLGLSSTIIPKMLQNLLSHTNFISFSGCLTQVYFFVSFCATENFLLASMAYDRYVAICRPLYYTRIMSYKCCLCLAVASWLTTVALFYGTLLGIYIRPSSTYSGSKLKIASILYTMVTPMLNPFVYSLRNSKMHEAMKKIIMAS
ncbi:olfactory receptor-like protein DTMT [Python bivittatus]|uniref:Olfactory receptor-like protein DTMT n=1 Tax=Python bivittatus TaxID=176946 RepID=A0A9F5J9J8_PYTBI|nr:olfactory receptor-like protein DTMT [Python bivittatus]